MKTSDSRKKITIKSFGGDSLKADWPGGFGVIRCRGLKFGPRKGVLTTRGGWEDWSPSGITGILGIKRWYREDSGRIFLYFTAAGALNYLKFNDLGGASFGTYPGIFNTEFPVQFENCGSVIVIIPYTDTSNRPYSLRIDKHTNVEGGLQAKLLGLDPPTDIMTFVSGSIAVTGGGNVIPGNALDDGVYKYCATYSYGTKDNPGKWGESAPGPVVAYDLSGITNKTGIIQLGSITAISDSTLYQKINIYRTLKNQNTFYKIGEITLPITTFNDTVNDSLVDTSKTLPTETGLPYGMRCAMWHPQLQRLFWFGEDNYLHYSSALFPDINPVNNKFQVGSLGHAGNGIVLIRNAMYAIKEDGIFIISGNAPNYTAQNINNCGCFSKCSVSQATNGLTFYVGKDGDDLAVYMFDGNNSSLINENIDDIITFQTQPVYNKLVGKVIGSEYWLSVISSDPRFVNWPIPYNNIILIYDINAQRWTDVPSQAGMIEYLDGHGDSGEIFESESDMGTNRGNIFRWNTFGTKYNKTTYVNGVNTYSKGSAQDREIFLGNIVAETEDLQKIKSLQFDVVIRGFVGRSPSAVLYSNARLNSELLMTAIAEADTEFAKVPSLSQFGQVGATYGNAKFYANFASRRRFLLVDIDGRLGVSIKMGIPAGVNGIYAEIESAEFMYEPTNLE